MMKSAFILTVVACMGMLSSAQAQQPSINGMSETVNPNALINRNVKCDVPFPQEAMRELPAGFKGETVALLTFNVEGRFRFARVLKSSGNEKLDHAAIRGAVEARCEPFGNPADPALEGSLIGIPYSFVFDNSRGSDPVQVTPIR